MANVNEAELTASIVERLEELGFSVGSPRPPDQAGTAGLFRPDLLATRPGAEDLRFVIEVKLQVPRVPPPRELVSQGYAYGEPAIFAFPHVTPGDAARLRAQDLNYIDSGGNAWIEAPGLTLWIEGRNPAYRRRAGAERPSRAFRPAGLRVLFSLLSEPRLQSAPLREIAAASGVSLGAVSNTLADLKETGALGITRGRRLLAGPDQLRDAWIEHYVTTLRPTLDERRVKGPAPHWWSTAEAAEVLRRTGTQIGGESALASHGLRPEGTVLYGAPPWRDIVHEMRMPADGEGNVVLRERFWDVDVQGDELTVPPLLVLADAVASGDARQIEIARAWDHERVRV